MTILEYRRQHVECAILKYFPGLRIPTGTGGTVIAIPHWGTQASELHHIIPRSSALKRFRDDLRNLIHLHQASHQFVTEFSVPGTVMCLLAKSEMGELDIRFLSECCGRDMLEFVQADDTARQCSRWDWMTGLHHELKLELGLR